MTADEGDIAFHDRVDRRVRRGEGSQPRDGARLHPLAPLVFGQIELVRRQRLVEGAALIGERFLPRLVVVLDLRQPFARGWLLDSQYSTSA